MVRFSGGGTPLALANNAIKKMKGAPPKAGTEKIEARSAKHNTVKGEKSD